MNKLHAGSAAELLDSLLRGGQEGPLTHPLLKLLYARELGQNGEVKISITEHGGLQCELLPTWRRQLLPHGTFVGIVFEVCTCAHLF